MKPTNLRKDRGLPPSLLDVILVVLLLFIMLSSLASVAERESKERTLPPIDLAKMEDKSEKAGTSALRPLVISVSPGPIFYIDSNQAPLDQVRTYLKEHQPGEIELRAATNVLYGEVARILKVCRETGNSRISLTYRKDN